MHTPTARPLGVASSAHIARCRLNNVESQFNRRGEARDTDTYLQARLNVTVVRSETAVMCLALLPGWRPTLLACLISELLSLPLSGITIYPRVSSLAAWESSRAALSLA